MKFKVLALSIVAVVSFSGLAAAEDMAVQDAAVAAPVVEQAAPAVLVAVGNKVCPVSGQAIPAEALGQVTVEYNGKIYNLCCPGCKDIFLADGEKFSKKAEAEVSGEPVAQTDEAPAMQM